MKAGATLIGPLRPKEGEHAVELCQGGLHRRQPLPPAHRDHRRARRVPVRLRHRDHLRGPALHPAGPATSPRPSSSGSWRAADRGDGRRAGSGWLPTGSGASGRSSPAARVYVVGGLGSAFAPGIEWLLARRFVLGLAVGTASFVSVEYISEQAPPRLRGGVTSFNQLMVTTGILMAYLVAAGVPERLGHLALDARALRGARPRAGDRHAHRARVPAVADVEGPRRRGAAGARAHPRRAGGRRGDRPDPRGRERSRATSGMRDLFPDRCDH